MGGGGHHGHGGGGHGGGGRSWNSYGGPWLNYGYGYDDPTEVLIVPVEADVDAETPEERAKRLAERAVKASKIAGLSDFSLGDLGSISKPLGLSWWCIIGMSALGYLAYKHLKK